MLVGSASRSWWRGTRSAAAGAGPPARCVPPRAGPDACRPRRFGFGPRRTRRCRRGRVGIETQRRSCTKRSIATRCPGRSRRVCGPRKRTSHTPRGGAFGHRARVVDQLGPRTRRWRRDGQSPAAKPRTAGPCASTRAACRGSPAPNRTHLRRGPERREPRAASNPTP